MQREELKKYIRELAEKYNVQSFIEKDPVQFPHRYKEKKDVEISAVITQWISYGNRKKIVETGEILDSLFRGEPYKYIMSEGWKKFHKSEDTLYRFYKRGDFYDVCERRNFVYSSFEDLESTIDENLDYAEEIYKNFSGVNGFPNPKNGSASKRLWMMLRWLVRRDGIVDLGIWRRLSPAKLMIPVDVHVLNEGRKLGLTNRKTASILVSKEITEFMQEVFEDDPCKGDFALFGLGVDR